MFRFRVSKGEKWPAGAPKNLMIDKNMLYSHNQTYANRFRFARYVFTYQHYSFVQYDWEKEYGHLLKIDLITNLLTLIY